MLDINSISNCSKVIQIPAVSQSTRLCIRFWAIAKAKTRPFTCQAIMLDLLLV